MPTFDVTSPDGKTYEVTAPDGASQNDVMNYVQQHHAAQTAAPASDPAQSTLMQRAASSLPVRVARGMMDPVMGGIQAIAHGVAQIPGADPSVLPQIDQGLQRGEQMYQADRKATGQSGLDLARIGGNIASPLNYMAPELGLASKLGTAGRVINGAINGAGLGGLQPVFDPNNYAGQKASQVELGAAGGAAFPALGAAAKATKSIGSNILGATTGAGAAAVKGAYAAGKAGGDAADAFTSSMRDPSTWGNVVSDAKAAVANLRAQRSQIYNSGMVDISKDATVLDFKPIDDAMAKTTNSFKGQDLSPKTTDVRQEIASAVDHWKALPEQEYHTPEGFDALKQQLGGIRDSYQYGTPQWKIASDTYNAVRQTIADQAPTYNKVMGDYSKASDQISELEKELSLGRKGNPNTALRKLQSVMRDNANTSWGKRSQLAGDLQDAGATNLMPSLAGQALSSPLPRGLAKYGDLATGLTVGAATHGAGLPLLLAASPRLVGEAAYGAGKVAGSAGNASAALRKAFPALNNIPSLPPGLLGAGLPQLLLNTSVNGAQ